MNRHDSNLCENDEESKEVSVADFQIDPFQGFRSVRIFFSKVFYDQCFFHKGWARSGLGAGIPGGIFGPVMFGVAATQIFSDLLIASGPERIEVGRDLAVRVGHDADPLRRSHVTGNARRRRIVPR